MHHPYTFEKVNEIRRDELLREVQQWERYKAWRAAHPPVQRRSSLVGHVLQVLRRMARRGQVQVSDG